jgi:UPF0042 nucleotide-binding protein
MTASVEWVIVTGLSGSGKTLASHCFEDMGFFCVDNLPLSLLPAFRNLVLTSQDNIRKVALVADVREGGFLKEFPRVYKAMLEDPHFKCTLVFFEASTPVLLRRFSETRRRHPLEMMHAGGAMDLGAAVEQERRLLAPVRELADIVIDTSDAPPPKTLERLRREFSHAVPKSGLRISVVSFGFKYGVPANANLVFDARFLPNPHYDEALRPHDGRHPAVREFLAKNGEYGDFLAQTSKMLAFLVPLFEREGRSYLTVAVGCTGGKHRSVALAEDLAAALRGMGREPRVEHRDKDAE